MMYFEIHKFMDNFIDNGEALPDNMYEDFVVIGESIVEPPLAETITATLQHASDTNLDNAGMKVQQVLATKENGQHHQDVQLSSQNVNNSGRDADEIDATTTRSTGHGHVNTAQEDVVVPIQAQQSFTTHRQSDAAEKENFDVGYF